MSKHGIEPLPAGHEIMEHIVRSVIGEGGFGIVYLAEHPKLHIKAAVKEFAPFKLAYRDDSGALVPLEGKEALYNQILDRFDKTAAQLCALDHPNIVKVYNQRSDNNTSYVLMEFVTGQTFGDWVHNRIDELDYARLKQVFLPLLDAIGYLHERHLMHRDIAPDNILMRQDGQPILIDFGTLKQHVLGEETNLEGTEDTDPSAVVAKKFFSPPEQFSAYRKSELGSTADIYSLGATIYDVLAGRAEDMTRHLVPATDRASNVVAPGGRAMPPLHEVSRVDLPRGFCDAVDAALNLSPRDRPRTIKDFRDLLFSDAAPGPVPPPGEADVTLPQPGGLAEVGPQASPPSPPPQPPVSTGEGGGFRWGRLAGGTVGALAIAAGVYVFVPFDNLLQGGGNSQGGAFTQGNATDQGGGTTAQGDGTLVQGGGTTGLGSGTVEQGGGTATQGGTTEQGGAAVVQGGGTPTQGGGTLAQGGGTLAQGGGAVAQGGGAVAQGGETLAQGDGTLTQGGGTPTQDGGTVAQGGGTVVQGGGTLVQGGGTTGDPVVAPPQLPPPDFQLTLARSVSGVSASGFVPPTLRQTLDTVFGAETVGPGLLSVEGVAVPDQFNLPQLVQLLRTWSSFNLTADASGARLQGEPASAQGYFQAIEIAGDAVTLDLSFLTRTLPRNDVLSLIDFHDPCGTIIPLNLGDQLTPSDQLALFGHVASTQQRIELTRDLVLLLPGTVDGSTLFPSSQPMCDVGRQFRNLVAGAPRQVESLQLSMNGTRAELGRPVSHAEAPQFAVARNALPTSGFFWSGLVMRGPDSSLLMLPLSQPGGDVENLAGLSRAAGAPDYIALTRPPDGTPNLDLAFAPELALNFDPSDRYAMLLGLVLDREISGLPALGATTAPAADQYLDRLEQVLSQSGARILSYVLQPIAIE
jgi:serine/threonine protein kinase